MSQRDWLQNTTTQRTVAALLAAVIAAGFSFWLWPDAPPIPQRQTLEDYSAFAQRIDPECADALRDDSAASPYQKDECANKEAVQRKGYRDLAQSIRASNAAEEAAWLSYLQTRAAIVGSAFIVLTLFATAWAAWAAADAARIAKDSVIAAARSADAAEKSIFEVEAPFLYPVMEWNNAQLVLATGLMHGAGYRIKADTIAVGYRIRNFGRSTAIVHVVDASVHFTESPPLFSEARPNAFDAVSPTLEAQSESPDRELVERSKKIPDGTEIAAIKNMSLAVYFLGSIEYSSVQGARYIQTFCLTYNPGSDRFSPWPSNLNRRTRQQDEA